MNTKTIEKLMGMLPEGNRKEALRQKLNAFTSKSQKRGGDGLQDSFEFTPKGHIRIEAIDETGSVVGTLADQPNLVVDGAEEILLRAFSGDPNRSLFKNRVPKSDVTGKIHIDIAKLAGAELFDGDQLLHAPNILWAEVDDDQFDISYAYYPVVVYVKEEVSTEFGKKAFSISKAPGAGYVPMGSEVYSGYSNMFIGIGEGKNLPVTLTDNRLSYSEGFAPVENVAKTTVEGSTLSFNEKVSNFVLEYEASNKGAQIDVLVNGALRETIETLDSELESPEVRTYEINDLDYEVPSEIKFVHSGSDSAVENAEMTITGLRFDALTKGMNGLMKEFNNYEVDFLTPAVYNTTPMGPFTIQLPNFPVKQDSVKISYNEVDFTQVESEEELADNTFIVDHLHGIVQFNRALTGVSATYSITGEIYDSELASTMTQVDISYNVETDIPFSETPQGVINGANKAFTMSKENIKEETVIVKVDGEVVVPESINVSTGRVILAEAPVTRSVVTVEYTYVNIEEIVKEANKYNTGLHINEGTAKVFDQNGAELSLVTTNEEFGDGKFMIGDLEETPFLHIAKNDVLGQPITKVEVVFKSDEKPGFETNYKRAVIQKPKTVNEYPWFELDNGSVRFVAEFPELSPAYNVTIREMGLFDGPRADDKVAGFRNFPVKAFSLVRVGETRKDVNTGIRITWTITLLNNEGQPFQGGRN
jgi:hypothetical protein